MASVHMLMCKKIAQLTKVIYQLNTVNEDHTLEMEATKREHRAELNEAMRDAASKLKRFESEFATLKKSANAVAQLEREREKHQLEKERALATFKERTNRYREETESIRNEVAKMRTGYAEKLAEVEKERSSEGERQIGRLRASLESEKIEAMAALKKEVEARASKESDNLLSKEREQHRLALQDKSNQYEELKKERNSVAKDLDSLAKEKSRIEMERNSLQEENVRERAKANRLCIERDELSKAHELLQKECDGLSADKSSLASERDRQSVEMERLRDEIRNEKGKFEALCVEKDRLLTDIQRLKSEKVDVERNRDLSSKQFEAELRQTRDTLSTEKDRAEEQYRIEKESLESQLKEARETAAAEKFQLENQLREARGQLSDDTNRLGSELRESKVREAQLSAEKVSLDQDLSSIRLEFKAYKDRCDKRFADNDQALSAVNAELLRTEEEARRQSSDAERFRVAEAARFEEALSTSESRLSQALISMESQREDYEKKLVDASLGFEKELAEARRQRDDERSSHLSERQALRCSLDEALSKSSEDVEVVKATSARLESELTKTTSQLSSAKTEFKRQQAVVDSLKSQVEELRHQLESTTIAAKKRLEETVKRLGEEWTKKRDDAVETARAKAQMERAQDAESAKETQRIIVEKLEGSIEDLSNQLARGKRQNEDLTKSLESVRRDLDEARAKATREIAQLTKSLSQTSSELADSRHQHDEDKRVAKSRIDHLEKSVNAATEAQTAERLQAEARLQDTTSTLSELRQELAEKSLDLKATKTRCEELAESLESSYTSLRRAERRALDDARTAESRHATEVGNLRDEHAANTRKLHEDAAQEIAALNEEHRIANEKAEEAMAQLVRDHDDFVEGLRRIALDSDEAANAAARALEVLQELSYARKLEKIESDAKTRHHAMLEAFEADREARVKQLASLDRAYAELEDKYQNRESRPEDLEKIAELDHKIQNQQFELERVNADLQFVKRELLNREENFNRRFNNIPRVGVMNNLKQQPQAAAAAPHGGQPQPGRRPSQGSYSGSSHRGSFG